MKKVISLYAINYDYLRPKKAAAMKKQHEVLYQCISSPAVWEGKNATVLPVRKIDAYGWIGCGGVVDAFGNNVDISSVECCVKPTTSFTNPEFRDEKVVYCGYMIHHWGHFLMEGAARLWYFLENDPTVDKYVFALDEGQAPDIKGNYLEFFQLLGIWDKLEFVNRPTTYREVIVPDLSFRRFGAYSSKFLDIFNTIANNAPVPSEKMPQKIYMSRSHWHKDVEFGFEALDNLLKKNGFTILYPENIPLSKMIHYIRNADIVASDSGSTPHNMMFGKQGQKLIILERCAIIDDWQPPVNRIKELQTTYIDANIAIYTVPMTGPFIMGYTDMVQQYVQDNHYLPPDSKFLTKKYFRSCFKGYMNAYADLYHYRWFIEEYLLPEMDYHLEAYEYGYSVFEEYLNGSRPFLWHHYFEVHYWKQFVKRILCKLSLRKVG